MTKPNIIVILADDMAYGDIGCFGNPDVQTPNLDRLASDGICLTQHYSASPVCAPARAGLMTGRYPHRTGTIDTLEGRGLDRLCLDEVTIADTLKSAGYATGLVGKWHLGAIDPRYHPNRRGFDETACFRGGWSDYWQWRLDYNGSFKQADGRYLTDVFSEEAVGFISRHRDKPFFLHLTYNAPHFPMQVPDEDADPFREMGKFTEGVCRVYGMNRRMDTGIGRILDELDRLGLSENTLVFFASDNGPDFTGAGDMCKRRSNGDFNGEKCLAYEGGVRVPAMVRWPAGLQGGQRLHDVLHFTDWHPTLASVAGANPAPRGPLDGRNMLPALRGEQEAEDRTLFWQWNRYTPVPTCNAAVRSGPWKLVRPAIEEAMHMSREDGDLDNKLKYEPDSITDIYRGPEPARTVPPPPPPLLFNIDDDPYERNDLASQRPEMVSKLQQSIDQWFESVERDRLSIGEA